MHIPLEIHVFLISNEIEYIKKVMFLLTLIKRFFGLVREEMVLPTKLLVQMILVSVGMGTALSIAFLLHIKNLYMNDLKMKAETIAKGIEESGEGISEEKLASLLYYPDVEGVAVKGDRIIKKGLMEEVELPLKVIGKYERKLRLNKKKLLLYGIEIKGNKDFYILFNLHRLKSVMLSSALTAVSVSLVMIIIILAVGISFNHFEIVKPIREGIFKLGDSITEMKRIYLEVKTGSTEQAASVNELSAASEEVAASAAQIAEMISQIEGASKTGVVLIESSVEEVNSTVDKITVAKNNISNLSQKIMELSELSRRITKITSFIEEISDQTNLLSVNATIEAIGAGESGRRFGVVAGEIRELSERTKRSTEEIGRIIDEINASVTKTVMVTEKSVRVFDELMGSIHKLKYIFDELKDSAKIVLKMAEDIKSSTEQQVSSTEQMAKALNEVNEVAQQIAENAATASSITERLEPIINVLRRMV